MKIKGKSKNLDMIICASFWSRLKGNMGKKEINNVLFFPKCNSIHTFFMRTNIDVIMISKDNIVKFVYKNLSPYKIIWPKKDVYATVEFPALENNYQIGDKFVYENEDK